MEGPANSTSVSAPGFCPVAEHGTTSHHRGPMAPSYRIFQVDLRCGAWAAIAFATVLVAFANVARAQAPENARRVPWGKGWECDRGFYESHASCKPVVLPEHAVLDYSGHRWECERGYRKDATNCVEVVVPPNASLSIAGHAWTCDRGYRRVNESCAEITIATASDAEIRRLLVSESIASYPGRCPCPYFVDRAGRMCGARSAYSRPGGASPLC
jgi:hypothetical protein